MLAASNYPLDIRVKQEAELLTSNHHDVTVLSLKGDNQSFFEKICNVNVYRIPNIELFKRGKHSKAKSENIFKRFSTLLMAILGYGFEFVYFTFTSFFLSFWVAFRHGFDVVHAANPPDTLFLIGGFWKIIGKIFIYDHHDLSPDLFVEKYGNKITIIYYILLQMEKCSCKLSDFVIDTNESYKKQISPETV